MGNICCVKKNENILENDIDDLNIMLNFKLQENDYKISGIFTAKILSIKFDNECNEYNECKSECNNHIYITFVIKECEIFKQLTFDFVNSIDNINLLKKYTENILNKICQLDLNDLNKPKITYCDEDLNDYLSLLDDEI